MEKVKIIFDDGREGLKEAFIINKDEDLKLCIRWITAKYEYFKNKVYLQE